MSACLHAGLPLANDIQGPPSAKIQNRFVDDANGVFLARLHLVQDALRDQLAGVFLGLDRVDMAYNFPRAFNRTLDHVDARLIERFDFLAVWHDLTLCTSPDGKWIEGQEHGS